MFNKGVLILLISATLFVLIEVKKLNFIKIFFCVSKNKNSKFIQEAKAEVKKSTNELQNDSFENGKKALQNGNDRDDDDDDDDDMKKKRSLQTISKKNANINEHNNRFLQKYNMHKKSISKKSPNAHEHYLMKRFRGLSKVFNYGSNNRNYHEENDSRNDSDDEDEDDEDDYDDDESEESDEKRSLNKKKRQLKLRSLQKRFRYNYQMFESRKHT